MTKKNSILAAQERMVRAVNDGVRVVNMSLQWIDNNARFTPDYTGIAVQHSVFGVEV